jgi:HAD superfamily hydrolase (TIGR01490 family)
MSKKFAVFDIDGTLIRWQLYHAVVNELAKQGILGNDTYEKIHTYRMSWKEREHPDSFKIYERQLIDIYDETIIGIETREFERASKKVIQQYINQTYVYTRELIKDLLKNNYTLLAISGSQDSLVKMLGDYYGFTESVGTEYMLENGRFNGNKKVASLNKALLLRKLIKKHKLTYEDSLAVGDTMSDAPLLEMVDRPIAFNPDALLFQEAQRNKWNIIVERKNVVYELISVQDSYQLKT